MKTEEEIKAAISVTLVKFRRDNNLTQKQMGAMLGMKRYNYAKIESRVIRPSLGAASVICSLTGKSIDEMCADYAHSQNVCK